MANVYSHYPDEQPSTNSSTTAATSLHFIGGGSITTAASSNTGCMAGNPTPLSNNNQNSFQDQPCEKYRQFMDSSIQERTFMIEKLVETFANVIDSIWHPKFLVEQQQQQLKVMPTRGFCNEILKRSKATYSTLQISLFYIFRVKKVVHEKLYQRVKKQQSQQKVLNMQTSINNEENNKMEDLQCCGRRMFLASLMVASKYLHDKNYQNKAWSKITGLDIKEINAAEMAFLNLIDYKLYVSKPTFDKWYTQLHGHIQKSFSSSGVKAVKGPSPPIGLNPFTANTSCSLSITQAQQAQQQFITVQNTSNGNNYPSPPLDMNNNNSTSCSPSNESIISTSSSSQESISSQDSIQTDIFNRVDSGVSFDIYSPSTASSLPNSIVGQKRSLHHNQEEYTSEINDNNKRICH